MHLFVAIFVYCFFFSFFLFLFDLFWYALWAASAGSPMQCVQHMHMCACECVHTSMGGLNTTSPQRLREQQ